MTRWFIIPAYVFLTVDVALALPPVKPQDKPADVEKPGGDELKKPKKPAQPGEPAGESEEAKILERLTKNTREAEEKLGAADTGDSTRKLQRDILKDIDELLKKLQQPPQDSQDQQSSSSSSSSQQKPMDGSSSQQPMGGSAQQKPMGGSSGQKKSGLSRREQREQKRQQQAKNRGSANPTAQNNQKPMGDQQPMPGDKDPKTDGAGTGGQNVKNNAGGGKPDGKQRTDADAKLAEMYKDVWGHLPEKMRQEMDAYFKDRFMPRYNDLLKQYYSTIAEQHKKK